MKTFRTTVRNDHFAKFLPHGFTQPRFDAAESIFVERALLAVEAQPYNTLVPPLKGRKFVPTDNTTHSGAKQTSYRQYTRTGLARLITSRGQDVPTVGLFVKEFVHNFYEVAAAYEYSYIDLLAIGMAMSNGQSVNLDLELSIAAREAIEKKFDLLAAWGSANSGGIFALEDEEDVGLVGLINMPNTATYTIPTGAAGGTTWASKTPDEVLADLVGIASYIISSSYETFVPDTILVPTSQYEAQLVGRSMGDGRSDTILSYFLKTNPHIKAVESWPYLVGAGAAATDRMICYKRDPRYIRHMVAMEATPLPPTQVGMMMTTVVLARSAGAISSYPLSIANGDGI